MKVKKASIISSFTALLLCFCVVLNSGSVFAAVSSDFLNVDSIEIIERHGIVEGSSFKLSAEIMPENAVESAVKWSSSNPSVISCTDDGVIIGIKAGKYADITCKARFGSESDKIRVYCVESTGSPVKSGFDSISTPIYGAPKVSNIVAWYFDLFPLFREMLILIAKVSFVLKIPMTTVDANEMILFNSKCTVWGKYDSYAYITFDNGSGERDGFVKYTRLTNPPEDFLKLSAKNMDVWGNGNVNTNKKLTSNYKGKNKVHWDVADESIAEINEETGQVTGKKPGKTTITATVDGMTAECTIHSLYRWPQTWKTKTNCNTNLYRADTSEYVITNYMPKGTVFEVFGDNGTSDGWAYGCATINGKNCWGYVPIDKVSVKGTISQYRNLKTTLNGARVSWLWPVRNTKKGVAQEATATYVSSPYGWRNLGDSSMHKGIDITTGKEGQIEGYDVISTCAGKVVYVGYDSTSDYGYCLSVRSDEKDPITGMNYVVTYMHLNSPPIVERWDDILAGQVLGYVGNTSSSPGMGYHLHFEINCKNSPLKDGSGTRNSYDNLINPIFIFVDKCEIGEEKDKEEGKIIINQGSDAVSKFRGAYWYGDNTGKENN